MNKQQILELFNSNTSLVVTFTKRDGSIREMICTRDPELLPKTKGMRTPSDEVCTVLDLEKMDWRCFRYDSVLKVEVE